VSEPLRPAGCADRRRHYDLQDVWTCRYSVTPAQLTPHRRDCTSEMTQHDGAKQLAACNVASRQDEVHSVPLRASFA
jgi:hypothetical protein